jgi:hypothetical protein
MKKVIKKLYREYLNVEVKLRAELEKLGQDECNCEDSEEINLVNDNGGMDIGIDRRCGNCGGVIWDREI